MEIHTYRAAPGLHPIFRRKVTDHMMELLKRQRVTIKTKTSFGKGCKKTFILCCFDKDADDNIFPVSKVSFQSF